MKRWSLLKVSAGFLAGLGSLVLVSGGDMARAADLAEGGGACSSEPPGARLGSERSLDDFLGRVRHRAEARAAAGDRGNAGYMVLNNRGYNYSSHGSQQPGGSELRPESLVSEGSSR